MEKRLPSSMSPSTNETSDTEKPEGIKESSIPDQLTDSPVETAASGDEDYKYVTGFKLAIVIISVTFVAFLMMLDTAIVATVRLSRPL
jgi:hypothetical protein